ncbi:MAG: hypothetical protein LBQ83_06825 [Candidatus Margulisbacteria bacterium]|jgi:DNA polymerase III delta prime subunit|nr:hypothetical protein [Candidatus Margulisiibacteriota bacterium]
MTEQLAATGSASGAGVSPAAGLQKRAVSILQGIVRTGRVANAYLFVGPPMSGKTAAAREFFRGLNKLDRIQTVDYFELAAEKSAIAIEQIRALKSFVQYGPHEQQYLLVVVQKAEKLSLEAANAFLKLLEEPPDGVVFILETVSREALPATIVSRCQAIQFDQLPDAAVRSLLADNPDAEEITALSAGLPHFAALLKEQLAAFREFVGFARDIKAKNFAQIAQYAEALGRDKELLQNYLLLLAQYFRARLDVPQATLALQYAKILRRNINLKLTLEVMFLRMRDL